VPCSKWNQLLMKLSVELVALVSLVFFNFAFIPLVTSKGVTPSFVVVPSDVIEAKVTVLGIYSVGGCII